MTGFHLDAAVTKAAVASEHGELEFYTIQELDVFLMDTDEELEIFEDTSSEGHVSDYEATPAPLTPRIFIQPPMEVEQSPDESSESSEQPTELPKVVKVKVAELQGETEVPRVENEIPTPHTEIEVPRLQPSQIEGPKKELQPPSVSATPSLESEVLKVEVAEICAAADRFDEVIERYTDLHLLDTSFPWFKRSASFDSQCYFGHYEWGMGWEEEESESELSVYE